MEQGPLEGQAVDEDRELLLSVIDLVEKSIYSSMDASHQADEAALAEAIHTASQCNVDIEVRQSAQGDLGILHQQVQDKQQELNRLQGVVDDKTEVNNTKWAEFDSHMQMISPAPACPGLPARTMPALDVFFEKSEYSIWFLAQKASYTVVRDAFKAADADLKDAIHAYDVQKAVRDVQYCDWKSELEAACAAFDTCFSEKSDFYTNTLVPRVTADMNSRIEVKKAGDTVIHQINFLLGAAAEQDTPTIDTSRYQIDFPTLPPRGDCDLAPLDADEWVPTVTCPEASCGLFVESFQKYPGYAGDLNVQGWVTIESIPGSQTTAKQVLRWSLTGLDSRCSVGAGDNVKNGCGIHIHSGTNCQENIGGHFFSDSLNDDPWAPIVYVAGTGSQDETDGVEVISGRSSSDIAGRTIVVHELNGGRIACGVIGTLKANGQEFGGKVCSR